MKVDLLQAQKNVSFRHVCFFVFFFYYCFFQPTNYLDWGSEGLQ